MDGPKVSLAECGADPIAAAVRDTGSGILIGVACKAIGAQIKPVFEANSMQSLRLPDDGMAAV